MRRKESVLDMPFFWPGIGKERIGPGKRTGGEEAGKGVAGARFEQPDVIDVMDCNLFCNFRYQAGFLFDADKQSVGVFRCPPEKILAAAEAYFNLNRSGILQIYLLPCFPICNNDRALV